MTPEEAAADAVDKIDEPAEKTVVATRTVSDIKVEDGLMVPQSLSESARIAKALLESGCVPKQYKTVPQILMGMQVLRQLGLPDIACLSRLAIVNGSYSLWGDGPKGVCQREIADFHEIWFDAAYKEISFANQNLNAEVYGALCRVTRKGIPTPVERVFTVDDAKKAGLWGKDGPWRHYPKRMLQCRARAWALKDVFPDLLLGTDIAEYDHDATVDAGRVIETVHDRAPELAASFKN